MTVWTSDTLQYWTHTNPRSGNKMGWDMGMGY